MMSDADPTLPDGGALDPDALRLGSQLGAERADSLYGLLLDEAVALTEGAEPEPILERLRQSAPRVVQLALRALARVGDVDLQRHLARFLLGVTMGMTLPMGAQRAA